MNGPLFAFDRFTLLDGATGMNLIRAGMPAGVCPERWIAGAPEALTALQRRYAAAGSDAVYAPTFGANEVKLKKFGLADGLEALNARLVAVSRAAVGEGVAVGGDLSSPGVFLRPFGPLTFEELTAIFRRQAAALAAADVDFFAAETLMSLSEARAAVLAIRSVSDKPVLVTMTFGENGRTLSGETPAACLAAVQALGADAFGVNCSVGPDKVLAFMRPMAEIACVPLAAKPNAGTPRTAPDGSVYYDVTPESFAAHAADFAGIGVRVFGGCCGTDERHVAALRTALDGLVPAPRRPEPPRLLTDGRHLWPAEETGIGAELTLGPELGDELAELETDPGEGILLSVEPGGDAQLLSENQHLLTGPLVIRARRAEDAAAAARVYDGVAAVEGLDVPGTVRL